MKKITLLFAIIFIAAASVNAQTYTTAVGAKFYTGNGSVGGLNIRYSNTEHTALEGSLLFYSGGIGLEGLYQYQGPIEGADGSAIFCRRWWHARFWNGVHNSETAFALRLTGGVDYKFADAPIDVSLGFDPFFYLTPATRSNLALGIGFRYVLK